MAIRVNQRREIERERGPNPAVTLEYNILGTEDANAAEDALWAESDVQFEDLVRDSARVRWAGQGFHRGTVRYVHPDETQPETESSEFSFEISGQSRRVKQSIETLSRHAPEGEEAPNFGGAVEVTSEGIEGAEIISPSYAFSERHILPASTVNNAYKARLMQLVGRYNDNGFRGHEAGTVLLTGVSGSRQRGSDDFSLRFQFRGRANRKDVEIGPDIVIPWVRGWDYVWIRYEEEDDQDLGVIVQKPVAAYVERMYYPGNFAHLEIGTS